MPPLPVKVKSLTLSPFCVVPQSSLLMPALILADADEAGTVRAGAATSKAATNRTARQVIFPPYFVGASLVTVRPKRKPARQAQSGSGGAGRARNPGGMVSGQCWGWRHGIWMPGAGEKDVPGIAAV